MNIEFQPQNKNVIYWQKPKYFCMVARRTRPIDHPTIQHPSKSNHVATGLPSLNDDPRTGRSVIYD